ncbi:MAG TPA: tRNA dihydrouridine synthase DusB [Burkholderiales bacterium]|nr:tRNA dihydrouridine synthase DusB [Burkholderiales bacterium]
MRLGAHELRNELFVAPMAGVTDRAYRMLCRSFGAGVAVSEMVSSRADLRHTRKSQLRRVHAGEPGPVVVQIVGSDPAAMGEAARSNAGEGADAIDINMGCPAKKVCNVAAGSALLADEPLVAKVLEAVVAAATVPVTLKIRTGPNPQTRNAVRIAQMAEAAGIALVSIHGRTRACGFGGTAEYDTIAEVKAAVGIPVVANGDIQSPQDARRVLEYTGADAVMIGRAAHGRPWLFREIRHHLRTGEYLPPPTLQEIRDVMLGHLDAIYELYGSELGARIARKHIGWYSRSLPGGEVLRGSANCASEAARQRAIVERFFAERLDPLAPRWKRAA